VLTANLPPGFIKKVFSESPVDLSPVSPRTREPAPAPSSAQPNKRRHSRAHPPPAAPQ
jgi:hypothetical protein